MLDRYLHRAKKLCRILNGTIKEISISGFEKKRVCPVCGNKLLIYWPYGVMLREGAQCPHCSSMERHRTLWLYLESRELFRKEKLRMLHFAPEKAFIDQFSAMENIDYWPVDINPNMPGIRSAMDITEIPFEDGSMDVIICSHVLEHIPDEAKALGELSRVLAEDGIAIINVPVDETRETTFENPEYNTPELRLQYFGQHDHVRIYGRDYIERLRKVFDVEVIEPNRKYTQAQLKAYGVWSGDRIHLCRRK